MHFNVGSVMLAAIGGFSALILMIGLVAGARGHKPDPKPPATEAEARKRAVDIARPYLGVNRRAWFVSVSDRWPHQFDEYDDRNARHRAGYLVRQQGDQILVAAVRENEELTTVNNMQFTVHHT